jgi:uncharacterized membrane protein
LAAALTRFDWLLFFHLTGAFLLFCGAVAFHLLLFFAQRREKPSEISTILSSGALAEFAIQVGTLVVLVFGIWLAYTDSEIPKYKITDGWIIAALILWAAASGLGARGGMIYAEGRKLAAKLAAEGDAPTPELKALLFNRRAALMTWASTLMVVAILVLMVFKPGAP